VCSYSPNSKSYVNKLQANDSCLIGVKHYRSKSGVPYLYTLGTNRKLKLFDVRNTFECLKEVSLPATPYTFDLSASGKLAVSLFDKVDIMNDMTASSGEDD